MIKKILGFMLIFIFMTTTYAMATPEFAVAQSSVMSVRNDILTMPEGLVAWDGSTKTQPEGDGSESNPYKIANGAHLAWFSNKVSYGNSNGNDGNRRKCAVLVSDINMGGKDWSGLKIGSQGWNYAGKFDGQGHTIYNLTIKKADKRQGGLFSVIGIGDTSATIKNINFVNAKAVWQSAQGISSDTPAIGIVCGEVRFAGSIVENVHVLSGEITANSTAGAEAVGAIAGRLKGGTIKNCSANVDIKLDNVLNMQETFSSEANTLGVGGIVGTVEESTVSTNISQCSFTGSINAPVSSRVGGIVGNIRKTSNYSISDCQNSGNVTGYRQVGGVIGWAYDGSTATIAPERISNTGSVTAKASTNSYAAGLANGFNFSLLTSPSYSVGDVSAEGGFNETCALLYTSMATDEGKDGINALYKSSANAPLSANGIHISSAKNIIDLDNGYFKDGIATEYLIEADNKTLWYNTEENSGYPIPAPTATKNYFVTDGCIKITLNEEGLFPVTITPVSDDVTVTVDGNSQDIKSADVYTFSSSEKNAEIYVEGSAKITLNLGIRKETEQISNLSPSKIKVSYKKDSAKTIVLAFYKGNELIDVKYKSNVQAQLVDGEKYIFSTIDLSDMDVKGCTLKAFLWEGNDLTNVTKTAYIGRYNGEAASDEDKKAALTAVAESYALKGAAVQYDSGNITEENEKRYTLFTKAPEDYTEDKPGYVDESSFIYDVYYNAFGLEILHPLTADGDLKVLSGTICDIEDDSIKTGDVLLAEGKKMLHIGDGKLIWAEGESYDMSNGKENYEKYGAINEGNITDIDEASQVVVLRPFDLYEAEPLSGEIKSRIDNMDGIVAEKLSSHKMGQTAECGDEITFNIRIENTNDSDVTLDVTDEISEYTTLVSGCDDVNGRNLSWNITVPANTAEEISYTVKVGDNTDYYGKNIDGKKAVVGGIKVPCYDISIERTLNETDSERVNTAIYALSDSTFDGVTLIKWIYQVAFSRNAALSGTASDILEQIYVTGGAGGSSGNVSGEEIPETVASLHNMVVPTLFGGQQISKKAEDVFGDERAYVPQKSALVTGDILLVEKNDTGNMYIYNGEDFGSLTKDDMVYYDAEAMLESLASYDRYVVLRPSMVLTGLNHYKVGDKDVLTEGQEAAIKTAEAYLLRGGRMQYDDTRITSSGEYRWQVRERHPEEYTRDEWGYSNCAAFTFDVYYHGLDYDIGFAKELWNTSGLAYRSGNLLVYSYKKTGTETAEERKRVEEEVLSILQPADILVVKRENTSGHAMFYAGDETIIHSTGSNYDYTNSKETFEPTIRFRSVRDLFYPSGSCNIFGDYSNPVTFFGIVRPLQIIDEVPQYTKNRIKNMQNVKAEKLSSHPSLKTVNPGEEISYTFSLLNANNHAVTLDIKDTVPENTTYISGAETVSGNALSWRITIAPGERKEVTYKVRVNEGVAYDTLIGSEDGSVGGVPVNCPKIKVKRTLTKEEQATLKSTIETMRGTTLSGIALVNTLYKEVTGVDSLLPGSEYNDIINGVFIESPNSSGMKELAKEGVYSEMVIPSMYGGRKFYSPQWDYKRVRLPRSNQLMPGDVLVSRTNSAERLHMYDGEIFVDLLSGLALDTSAADKRLEWLIAYGRDFVILRPSMAIK